MCYPNNTYICKSFYYLIMHKFRYLLVIALAFASSYILKGQENEVMVGLRGGYNASFGGFASASVETHQTLHEHFMISGGVQYTVLGAISDAVDSPEYLKVKVNADGVSFDWQVNPTVR